MQMDPKPQAAAPKAATSQQSMQYTAITVQHIGDQITETRPEDGLPQRKTERMTQAT
jgi:hypothetical protein